MSLNELDKLDMIVKSVLRRDGLYNQPMGGYLQRETKVAEN